MTVPMFLLVVSTSLTQHLLPTKVMCESMLHHDPRGHCIEVAVPRDVVPEPWRRPMIKAGLMPSDEQIQAEQSEQKKAQYPQSPIDPNLRGEGLEGETHGSWYKPVNGN